MGKMFLFLLPFLEELDIHVLHGTERLGLGFQTVIPFGILGSTFSGSVRLGPPSWRLYK